MATPVQSSNWSDKQSFALVSLGAFFALIVAIIGVALAAIAYQDVKFIYSKKLPTPRFSIVPYDIKQSNVQTTPVIEGNVEFLFNFTSSLPATVDARSIVSVYVQNISSKIYLSGLPFWVLPVNSTTGSQFSLTVAVPTSAASAVGLINEAGDVQTGWVVKALVRSSTA